MMRTSLDFSQKTDLVPLARVANALRAVAAPASIEFFLMGAAARDLMLRHAHNIEPQRLTEDVDFAVMVRDWESFESLRSALVSSGQFASRPGPATHRFRHLGGLPLDIVPFGGIERADRTIAWPPDHAEVFDCFGAKEAFNTAITVQLPEHARILVASIPALTLLKITAWRDRKHTHPGRDAPDLLLYLVHYLDCGNLERAIKEHSDLFETDDFDYQLAGVGLLARDLAELLDKSGIEKVLAVISPEADEHGRLLLAHQSGRDLESTRRLLEAFCLELAGQSGAGRAPTAPGEAN
jgi:predicted nucleotidyltransferase